MLAKFLLPIILLLGVTKIDADGIEFIIRFEGIRTVTYRCQADKLTIGVGHTGKDVLPGMRITRERAIDIFKNQDVVKFERLVLKEIPRPMPQNQFNVAVDIAFNMGNVFRNTQLGTMMRANHPQTSKQIMKFVKYKDARTGRYQISKGLLRRATARAKEWDKTETELEDDAA